MHVVYLLENLSKKENPRFYIGSKQECDLIELRGIPTLVGKQTRRAYFGSSMNKKMREDLIAGHIFSAYILEQCKRREDVLAREREWLEEVGVVNSEMYYNMSERTDYSNCLPVPPNSIINIFGETAKKIAQSRSSMSKRNGTAKKLGFDDSYELSRHIASQIKAGVSGSAISESLGKHRHFSLVYVRPFDLDNLLEKDPVNFIEQAHDMDIENASYEMIGKTLGIESPTVFKALSFCQRFELQTARKLGMTLDELDLKVARLVLMNYSFVQVAKELGIDHRTAKKFFVRFFKRRFKLSDLE